MQIDYYNYKTGYVDPIGFKKGELYIIEAEECFKDHKGKAHDFTRLTVSIQGLVNRNFKAHGTAVALNHDDTDEFWLDYITQDGRTYEKMKRVPIKTQRQMLDLFAPFLKRYGIAVWDPGVPATANVAATACGLENYVPVVYSDQENSLYKILTGEYGVPVKLNLAGLFEGGKIGEKIAGTELLSTGSPKCDAYIWAMDKYFDRCNPEFLAYTLDGASSVEGNPVSLLPDAPRAKLSGIPNHDYFIHRQCFFFDLTSYGLEAPNDEPNQPVGADAATLIKLFERRYELAGGGFGQVLGFPPWHLKYTDHVGDFDLAPPRLEWHFVELCSSYNCGIEADAAHPCWMSNGSLYTNYERKFEPKGNAKAKDVAYDPDTNYYAICYGGDFDCSPWMKKRVPEVWRDKNLGCLPITYNYGINLIERIPMAFDFVYEHQTENDYFTAGEGVGYVIYNALYKGFEGREANPDYAKTCTLFKRAEYDAVVHRTLPDGDEQYYDYAKRYYDMLKIDISGMLLCAFSPMNTKSMQLLNRLSPKGAFLQNSTAGPYDLQFFEGVPYFRLIRVHSNTMQERIEWLKNQFTERNTQFLPLGFYDMGVNYATPTGVKEFVEAFNQYIAKADPGKKYKLVDVETFLRLVKEHGAGHITEA